MLPRAILFVNFRAETILKICAKITCEDNCNNHDRISHIISKSNEMRDISKRDEKVLNVTDIFFSIPRGKLILRQFCNPDKKGMLIFSKPHYSLTTSLPRLINNYKRVVLDNDLTHALANILTFSLNIERKRNKVYFTFILPNFVNIFIEHIHGVGSFVHIEVLMKSTQHNVNKNCNDAMEIFRNLMQELSITEDELI